MREAAAEWRLTHEECHRVRSWFKDEDWLTVRHEDVCQDPQGNLERIFGFVGIDPHLGSLDFRSAEHHIRGNNMRLGPSSEIKLDEKWKSNLTADDLREFEAVAGDMNRKFGYV
jgi:hypothetical protein